MNRYRNPTDRIINKILPNGDCWQWQGIISDKGYGLINVNQQKRKAHRYAYTYFVEEIPEGLTIDHLCRNRACVNPDHLETVTHEENIRRGVPYRLLRRTHCTLGHELTIDNIYRDRGTRHCKTCKKQYMKEYYRKKKLCLT